ncbi:spastin [Anaeramoeba ignava]|uniref:microtubule-severing ATPase n=1 Tax=Anaeramoeba ignava TaxID=1746090 RepID=A0A9Q0LAH0_ANAIG|nr:spastin [Anaeramoeba ignava]
MEKFLIQKITVISFIISFIFFILSLFKLFTKPKFKFLLTLKELEEKEKIEKIKNEFEILHNISYYYIDIGLYYDKIEPQKALNNYIEGKKFIIEAFKIPSEKLNIQSNQMKKKMEETLKLVEQRIQFLTIQQNIYKFPSLINTKKEERNPIKLELENRNLIKKIDLNPNLNSNLNQKTNLNSNPNSNLNSNPNLNSNSNSNPKIHKKNIIKNTKNFKTNKEFSQKTNRFNIPKRTLSKQKPKKQINLRQKNGNEKNNLNEEKLPVSKELLDQIENEIMDSSSGVKWENIAGLSFAKQALSELVILPQIRPELFTGLREPPKGLLLFGPPGNGKTMLAKAVATESNCTFFSISASSLTSKWVGESEKLVKAMFFLARKKQPSIVFVDEIDSILSKRKQNENESSRRLKTEFLIQLDGATTPSNDRILIMAATNRPWDLDDAVLRRLSKRVYVPLPDFEARKILILNLIRNQKHNLNEDDIDKLSRQTEYYSGSDLTHLTKEAAMEPIREIEKIETIRESQVRMIEMKDFLNSLRIIKPSLSKDSLKEFIEWNNQFGVVSKN